MTTLTEHRLQIERSVKRSPDAAIAYFKIPDGFELCVAFWGPGRKEVCISGTFPTVLSMEQASSVSIAIQMANNWLAEQP